MLKIANSPVPEPKPTEQSNSPVLYPRQAPEHPGTGLIQFERPERFPTVREHTRKPESWLKSSYNPRRQGRGVVVEGEVDPRHHLGKL